MKSLIAKLPSHLVLALLIATPTIVGSEIASATNVSNAKASQELTNSTPTINFSANLNEKLQSITSQGEGVLAARPQFALFDNGPSFVQNQPYRPTKLGNRPSAVATFEALLK